jgi:hypothetical protein
LRASLVEEAGRRGWMPFRSPSDADGCAHIVALSHPDRSAEDARRSARGPPDRVRRARRPRPRFHCAVQR